VPGVLESIRVSLDQMGSVRTVRTLLRVNQRGGFDCPGCAWPEPDHRHAAEFCENGAKAVAEEATLRRIDADFFARHPISELAQRSDWWLGQQGRLTRPMLKPEGADHYEPVEWDAAFDLIARELKALASPDEAVFYTSGRTSNEAAFCYQLFVRAFGTNNLPDCSNMCHESSGSALTETLGVGKGSVSIEDVYKADLIIIAGQNPGTNHPRMLSALERAKAEGARIVAVNPLPETGLMRFNNPQTVRGVLGPGTALADEYCQIRLRGDMALFKALGSRLIEDEEAAPGAVLDQDFIRDQCHGFEAYRDGLRSLSWDDVTEATGLEREQIERVHRMVRESSRVIVCWAMGLTQHRDSVPAIREIVNFLLLRGNVGRPGAGVCPVRGHSNVQGDRTMGIWEKPKQSFLDALEREFGFRPPGRHGHDVVDAIRAMRDGEARVFLAVGGNFVRATPDSDVTEAALRRCRLTVQVSTKLNRSHTVTGDVALILPTLGRTERDVQGGALQVVSVEDSMSMVHLSRGRLDPAGDELLSEVAIVCRLAERTLQGRPAIDWAGMSLDYDRIREHIAHVVPGCDDYNSRVRSRNGFQLPHGPRDSRSFPTDVGRAKFTVNVLQVLRPAEGRLILQTIRSHDQYNTTIYGLDDRYRGIHAGRRVVLVHERDLADRGLRDGDMVDLVSEWPDGAGGVEERRAPRFRAVAYPTAPGCAAAYFPETNVLVPLDSTAEVSNTPTSKSIVIRLEQPSPALPEPFVEVSVPEPAHR
jgi:molybdopterin-dependent oxidoreductase alpha subunit